MDTSSTGVPMAWVATILGAMLTGMGVLWKALDKRQTAELAKADAREAEFSKHRTDNMLALTVLVKGVEALTQHHQALVHGQARIEDRLTKIERCLNARLP